MVSPSEASSSARTISGVALPAGAERLIARIAASPFNRGKCRFDSRASLCGAAVKQHILHHNPQVEIWQGFFAVLPARIRRTGGCDSLAARFRALAAPLRITRVGEVRMSMRRAYCGKEQRSSRVFSSMRTGTGHSAITSGSASTRQSVSRSRSTPSQRI